MKRSLRRLDSFHQRLLETVSPLEDELFSRRPSEDEWCIAEIVQHLCLVEERVIKDLERGLTSEPQTVGLLRRVIPTSIVSLRLLKVKAPKAVNPLEVVEKNTAIENYNQARSSLKQLCDSHSPARFRQIVFNHPFLGKIDGVATVSFVGYHEHRHYKQIREVLKKIIKT